MKLRGITERARQIRARHKPPKCPDGWSTGAPDFVGLGVQRAGTTWWNHLIGSHFDVHAQPFKELHFLRQYWNKPFTADDHEKYAQYFPRPAHKITGEFSPGYLSCFWIPPLLSTAAPKAKFVILLRNPVSRYQSGLELQNETARSNAQSANRAFRLGCYAIQLENLFACVERSQILVLQFEKCLVDTGGELARTYKFLGLDPSFIPPDISTPRNSDRGKKMELRRETRSALVKAYESDVRRTSELIADLDLELWSDFAHLV